MRLDFFYFVSMEASFSIPWKNLTICGSYKKGKGIPWIFIHGFPQSSSSWKPIFPFVEHFYALDLPGFGNSDGTMNDLAIASDVIESIRQYFHLEMVNVAGHSMGGYIALEYCKRHGVNVAGLALIHSHPFSDDDGKKAKRDQSIALISKGQKLEFCKAFITSLFSSEYSTNNSSLISQMISSAAVLPDVVLTDALLAMRDRVSNTSVLEAANFPVLFVLGELDIAIPLNVALEQTYLPSLGLVKIAHGIGHQIMQENPGLLNQYLKEFEVLCHSHSSTSML